MNLERCLANESLKMGPLRVHPGNPRYFTDGSGKAVYLVGSNTWNALTDARFPLDYDAYLDFMVGHNHNLMKFRAWDSDLQFAPLYYKRTGPGLATDGGLKLDLNQFDQAYFDRMRQRVIAARERGIYVMIMLFETDEPNGDPALSDPYDQNLNHESPRRWNYHPYNKLNNTNGIDGGNADNSGHAWTETLAHPGITALREAYIRKVVDTVNDLDNVLFEIANESSFFRPDSTNVPYNWTDIWNEKSVWAPIEPEWSYHMVDYIHSYESAKPKQHPVVMSVIGEPWATEVALASNAEGISPGMTPPKAYMDDPPAADGSKVILNDPDHYGWTRQRGNRAWVWKSFARGLNPIPLDSLPNSIHGNNGGGWGGGEWPDVVEIRAALGHTRTYADKMDLAAMVPRNDLSSTTFCLANPGSEYLVYQPCSGGVSVSMATGERVFTPYQPCSEGFSVNLVGGTYVYEWFDALEGVVAENGSVTVPGGDWFFTPPPSFGGDAVLYLKSVKATPVYGS